MAKRGEPKMSAELLAKIESDPADGSLSRDILDVAFWRGEPKADDAWVAALDRLDRLRDKAPLQALLRSDGPLPHKVREYLADLIERGVPKPMGRPRIPAYRYSEADALLLLAHDDVRHYMRLPKTRRLTETEALDKVARERGLDEAMLANSFHGKRGSLTRRKQALRRP
jgi:hypothetical protein